MGDTRRHWLALLRPRPAECYQGAWLVLTKKDGKAIPGFNFLLRKWGKEAVIKEADAHATAGWGTRGNYKSLTAEIQAYKLDA